MKKIISYFFLICFLGLTASCSDDDTVEIVSLNTFGNKVSRNDKVKVFVSANIDDLEDTSYHWSCNGGEFISTQGLFENVWQAPNEPGVYEIEVSVKSNGGKDTRKANITVTDEYFYRDYGATYSNDGMSSSNMTTTAQANFPVDGYLTLTSTNNNSRYYRNFNDADLFPAFSWQMKYWPYKIDSDNDKVNFRINFNRPSGTKKYITRVEFQTYPSSGLWAVQYSYYDVAAGGESTGVISAKTTQAEANLIGGNGNKDAVKWRHMSMSIDEHLNLIIYLEGKQLLKTDALKQLETAEGYKFNISSAEVNMTNKVVGYFDDFVAFDNGTIMTGKERVR